MEENTNNTIKSITPHTCPNCGKEIYIETNIVPPFIGSVFTEEDTTKAKQDLLERINTMTLDEAKKEAVIEWINDPSTIFGPEEVEKIVLSLLKE